MEKDIIAGSCFSATAGDSRDEASAPSTIIMELLNM
jgi:hypothetical protein